MPDFAKNVERFGDFLFSRVRGVARNGDELADINARLARVTSSMSEGHSLTRALTHQMRDPEFARIMNRSIEDLGVRGGMPEIKNLRNLRDLMDDEARLARFLDNLDDAENAAPLARIGPEDAPAPKVDTPETEAAAAVLAPTGTDGAAAVAAPRTDAPAGDAAATPAPEASAAAVVEPVSTTAGTATTVRPEANAPTATPASTPRAETPTPSPSTAGAQIDSAAATAIREAESIADAVDTMAINFNGLTNHVDTLARSGHPGAALLQGEDLIGSLSARGNSDMFSSMIRAVGDPNIRNVGDLRRVRIDSPSQFQDFMTRFSRMEADQVNLSLSRFSTFNGVTNALSDASQRIGHRLSRAETNSSEYTRLRRAQRVIDRLNDGGNSTRSGSDVVRHIFGDTGLTRGHRHIASEVIRTVNDPQIRNLNQLRAARINDPNAYNAFFQRLDNLQSGQLGRAIERGAVATNLRPFPNTFLLNRIRLPITNHQLDNIGRLAGSPGSIIRGVRGAWGGLAATTQNLMLMLGRRSEDIIEAAADASDDAARTADNVTPDATTVARAADVADDVADIAAHADGAPNPDVIARIGGDFDNAANATPVAATGTPSATVVASAEDVVPSPSATARAADNAADEAADVAEDVARNTDTPAEPSARTTSEEPTGTRAENNGPSRHQQYVEGYTDNRVLPQAYAAMRSAADAVRSIPYVGLPLSLPVSAVAFGAKNLRNLGNVAGIGLLLHFFTDGESTKLATTATTDAIAATADTLREVWPDAAKALEEASPWIAETGIRIAGTPQDMLIVALDTVAEDQYRDDPELLNSRKFAIRLAAGAFGEAVLFKLGWSDDIDTAKLVRFAMEAQEAELRGDQTRYEYFIEHVAQQVGETPEEVKDALYPHRAILMRNENLAMLFDDQDRPDADAVLAEATDLIDTASPGTSDRIEVGASRVRDTATTIAQANPAVASLTRIANGEFDPNRASAGELSRVFADAQAGLNGGIAPQADASHLGFFKFFNITMGWTKMSELGGLKDQFNMVSDYAAYAAAHPMLAGIATFIAGIFGNAPDVLDMQRTALASLDIKTARELVAQFPTNPADLSSLHASADDLPGPYNIDDYRTGTEATSHIPAGPMLT